MKKEEHNMSNQETLNTQEKREYVLQIAEKLYQNNKAKNEELLYLLMQRLLGDEKPVRKQFVEKLMKRMFVPIESSKVDVMERLLTRYYRDENGKLKQEEKKIREIVSQDKNINDYWETNGKKLLTHQGIMKCADFVGVNFTKPDTVDEPNSNNDRGFYMVVEASSENRMPRSGAGSANEKNAKGDISGSYKFEMAHKRAVGRAFLTHMGLHDVYSSDESDSWSLEEMLKKQLEQQKKQLQQVIQQGKVEQNRLTQLLVEKNGEVKRRNDFIDIMLEYASLDENDEKYPNTRISKIIEKEDYEYLEQLKQHKDKKIAYTVKRLLALHGATVEEKEQIEQVQAAAVQEVAEEQNTNQVQQVAKQEKESENNKVVDNKAKPFELTDITEEENEEEPASKEENNEELISMQEKTVEKEMIKKESALPNNESSQTEANGPKPFDFYDIGDDKGLTTFDFTLDKEEEKKED